MWTTRFGKRGLYEFSMCLTEQEGVTGDWWCFLAFVFFASLVEILGCQDVYELFWEMLSCCKGWMFSLVRGVGGLQFFCATFASKV